ncbi:UNVERIFIED_CONTAM: hypothetical protein Sangu_1859700 [Sesamum angustifolium]|uniref:Transposase-associated domain-containing protein n=1 Tax=Sesamum angustifolium TaxID=2727405 RepID=A0AAW2M9C7_9LAMI
MYEKYLLENLSMWQEFEDGVQEFVNWAKNQQAYMNEEKIRCSCRKCRNRVFKTTDEIMFGICMKGFMEGHYNWTAHGEAQVKEYYDDPLAPISVETPVAPNVATYWGDVEKMNWDQRMIYDAAGPHFFLAHPNPKPMGAYNSLPTDGTEAGPSSYGYDVSRLSDRFFYAVCAADQLLYNGCDESQLSPVARLVNIKAENNMFERCYDQVSQWASDLLPRDHTLPSDYYHTKKLIRDLGMPVEKIHACKNGCMLYWKDDIGLEYCKFCGDPRYKPTRDRNPQRKKSLYTVLRYLPLIPRLQRLYALPATAEHMWTSGLRKASSRYFRIGTHT